MIGDWLKNILFDEFEQVDYLEDNNIDGHPTDWYEPIPLTPEILEKNGFYHETNVGFRFDDGCGGIVICDTWNKRIRVLYNYNIVYDNEYTLFCVHPLQHILKLCQIDKEIKL